MPWNNIIFGTAAAAVAASKTRRTPSKSLNADRNSLCSSTDGGVKNEEKKYSKDSPLDLHCSTVSLLPVPAAAAPPAGEGRALCTVATTRIE